MDETILRTFAETARQTGKALSGKTIQGQRGATQLLVPKGKRASGGTARPIRAIVCFPFRRSTKRPSHSFKVAGQIDQIQQT